MRRGMLPQEAELPPHQEEDGQDSGEEHDDNAHHDEGLMDTPKTKSCSGRICNT